uniref:Uncharacterized protein n=1 Tax=Sphaerodactylus townsendi TaxID=933632 RepID=A0ACB8F7V2_9SAUR
MPWAPERRQRRIHLLSAVAVDPPAFPALVKGSSSAPSVFQPAAGLEARSRARHSSPTAVAQESFLKSLSSLSAQRLCGDCLESGDDLDLVVSTAMRVY